MAATSLGEPPKTLGFHVSLYINSLNALTLTRTKAGHLQVAVKMDDRNGTVRLVYAAEQGQCDGMVSSQRDNSRQYLPVDGHSGLFCVGVGFPHKKRVMALLNLTNGPGVVVACDGDVATVEDSQITGEGIALQGHIVPPTKTNPP